MASIGGYSFVILDGELDPAGEAVEDITRPGVDGSSYRRIGKRAGVSKLKSMVDVANAAAANTAIANYKALQGTLVSVVDQHGVSWSNVMVIGVSPEQKKYVVGKSGGVLSGSTGYLVTCNWALQVTDY